MEFPTTTPVITHPKKETVQMEFEETLFRRRLRDLTVDLKLKVKGFE